MAASISFSDEIANMLHAGHGSPLSHCIQCGTCSATCPSAPFMDYTPRRLIGLINANYKEDVLKSNTFWYCASCYHCTVRCPRDIDIAGLMYALKRYSMWKNQYQEGLIGPTFSETFVKSIINTGRMYEPILATTYLFSMGVQEFITEAQTSTMLMLKGRIPLLPPRIKRLKNFKRMVGRILPLGGIS
jgi:heterodisulfide reductase subunit C